MRRTSILALVGAVAFLAGCSSSGSGASAPPTGPPSEAFTESAPVPTSTLPSPAAALPTVGEAFSLLSCPAHPKATVEIEGCLEHRIIRLDRRINAEAKAVYDAKTDTTISSDFAAAQQAWIGYRRAECVSESDAYAGGTLEPVAFANCELRVDQARMRELRAIRAGLSS